MHDGLREFYELLKRRRSVRDFLAAGIEEEKLNRLLDVLNMSQSAANRQPWHFVVVGGAEKDALNSAFTKDCFKKAPLAIVACAEPKSAWVRKADGKNYSWVDVTIALTEMITAATAEGIGSCWVAAIDPEEVKGTLGIPDYIEVVGIIVLGYPAEDFKAEKKDRKPLEEIIHHGRWQKQ